MLLITIESGNGYRICVHQAGICQAEFSVPDLEALRVAMNAAIDAKQQDERERWRVNAEGNLQLGGTAVKVRTP